MIQQIMKNSSENNKLPISIPKFYKGKSIFLTGATGSLGKLIIEKLLYSCPEIDKIYVLIRGKKGKDVKERTRILFESHAFDRVHSTYPGIFESKIVPLSGNIMDEKLGLSEEDENLIRRDVSIVFHVAASVKFDDPIDEAIITNTVSAKKIIDLAKTMPKLVSLIHISTAYSNCDRINIEEKIYPPRASWRDVIKMSNTLDKSEFRILTKKCIGLLPNTYVFSKVLAEEIMNEHRNELPIAIVRPSIVCISHLEPSEAWTDNMYGPVSLMIAFCLGILRCSRINPDGKTNSIPSDFVVNGSIIASWKTALEYDDRIKKATIPVYNACSPDSFNPRHGEFMDNYNNNEIDGVLKKNGIVNVMDVHFIKNKLWYLVNVLVRQMLSATFIDGILISIKKEPMLVKIRRKIYALIESQEHFAMNTFNFQTDNYDGLLQNLRPEDWEEFKWDFLKCNYTSLCYSSIPTARRTILKKFHDNIETNTKLIKMLYIIDRGAVYLVYSTIILLVYLNNIPGVIFSFLQSLIFF